MSPGQRKVERKIKDSSAHTFTKLTKCTETAALTNILLLLCSLDLVAKWKCCLCNRDLQNTHTQSSFHPSKESIIYCNHHHVLCFASLLSCVHMHYVFSGSLCMYSCSRKWRALGKSAGGLLQPSQNHEAYLLFSDVKFG